MALDYEQHYGHGTSGHTAYIAMAKLARGSNSRIVRALVTAFDGGKGPYGVNLVAHAISAAPDELAAERPK